MPALSRTNRAFNRASIRRQRSMVRQLADLDAALERITGAMRAKVHAALADERSPAKVRQIMRRVYAEFFAEIESAFVELAGAAWQSAVNVWADCLPPAAFPALLREDDDDDDDMIARVEYLPGRPSRSGRLAFAIFDPPSKDQTLAIIRSNARVPDGLGWKDRLQKWSRKITDPDALSDAIATAYSEGKGLDDLKKVVEPFVGGIGSSARRVARTEGMRIADEMQEETFRQAGDLIQGYQYIAVLDDVTRPAHAALHGKVYGKDEERPKLPSEPNCRCTYSPILISDAAIASKRDTSGWPLGPRGGTAEQEEAFGSWFDEQPPARQRAAVGREAWAAVMGAARRGVLGRAAATAGAERATWAQFKAARDAGVRVGADEADDEESLPRQRVRKPPAEHPRSAARRPAADPRVGLRRPVGIRRGRQRSGAR